MANITLTEVGDSLATIIAAEALGYLKANTVLARLVNRNYEPDVAQYGDTVRVPFTGGLAVNAKLPNATVTLQNPNDTAVNVVLNQHKEVSFLIEDTARVLARPDFLMSYMTDGLSKIAEDVDGAIAGLYTAVTQTITAPVTMGRAQFLEARRLLNGVRAPLRGRVAVIHHDAESELLAVGEFTNRDYAELRGNNDSSTQAQIDAFSGKFMGFDVYVDQGIKAVGGTVKNLFFHRDAFMLVTRPLPLVPAGMGVTQKVMSEDGIGVRVTMSYSPQYLGIQTTLDILYGVGVLRNNHAVMVATTDLSPLGA